MSKKRLIANYTHNVMCEICYNFSDGFHFGASSCRACAAFFRRTVQKNNTYKCHYKNQCSILHRQKFMCKSCRFTKCLESGMKKSAIQMKRDKIGNIEKPFLINKREFPILDSIYGAYKNLEERRRATFNNGENSSPRPINFKELKNVYSKDMLHVFAFLCESFLDFSQSSPDEKRKLFKNFFLPFTLVESSYQSYVNSNPDVMIIPSGDFVDYHRPETYFDENRDEMHNLALAEQFIHLKSNITIPFSMEKLDIIEFLFLISLILWENDGCSNSDSFSRILRIRKLLVADILYYYNNLKAYHDPALRLGSIMSILPSIQKSSSKFQTYLEIKNIINIYALPNYLLDMFTPNF